MESKIKLDKNKIKLSDYDKYVIDKIMSINKCDFDKAINIYADAYMDEYNYL